MEYTIVSRPSLPPKRGYVEVEYEDGSKGYEPTEEKRKEIDKLKEKEESRKQSKLELQLAIAELMEKQQADKLELQLAMAEFIEMTMEGGE